MAPFDYRVVPVRFTGCLHLKSAVTEVADGVLLANPTWVSTAALPGCEALSIDEREPHAANVLRIRGAVVCSTQYPWTRDQLAQRDLRVTEVDCSELAKAEGAVTCCSLVLEAA